MTKKDWLKKRNFVRGNWNGKHLPLINSQDVIFPLLHIKLGLMKNLVKSMGKNEEGFSQLNSIFSKWSYSNLKDGILIGPQIGLIYEKQHRKLNYEEVLVCSWTLLKAVIKGCLEMIERIMQKFWGTSC